MMAVGDKLKNFSANVQTGAKNASHSLAHITLRIISGFFIGLVLALIVQELSKSGSFMLLFVTIVFTAALYKALARLSLLNILIFDLICVLIGTVLRMYILIAP
ncbi:MAG: hypothetical protein ACK4VO_00015 [Pseudobdellovibrio sp.]